MKNRLSKKRKKPLQQRAEDTISVIYQATTRLLEKDDFLVISTNKIAKTAGISIGSVYKYFSDKEAILDKLSQTMMERDVKKLEESLRATGGENAEDRVRNMLKVTMQLFINQKKLRRSLMRLATVEYVMRQRATFVKKFIEFLLKEINAMESPVIANQTELNVYVLVEAILGVIRMSMIGESPYLETKELEDELVKLVMRYLHP